MNNSKESLWHDSSKLILTHFISQEIGRKFRLEAEAKVETSVKFYNELLIPDGLILINGFPKIAIECQHSGSSKRSYLSEKVKKYEELGISTIIILDPSVFLSSYQGSLSKMKLSDNKAVRSISEDLHKNLKERAQYFFFHPQNKTLLSPYCLSRTYPYKINKGEIWDEAKNTYELNKPVVNKYIRRHPWDHNEYFWIDCQKLSTVSIDYVEGKYMLHTRVRDEWKRFLQSYPRAQEDARIRFRKKTENEIDNLYEELLKILTHIEDIYSNSHQDKDYLGEE